MEYFPTNSHLITLKKQLYIYCVLSAYMQPTLEALAIYLYFCTGFFVIEICCQAIGKNICYGQFYQIRIVLHGYRSICRIQKKQQWSM